MREGDGEGTRVEGGVDTLGRDGGTDGTGEMVAGRGAIAVGPGRWGDGAMKLDPG